jgi:hypothetical protein
MVDYSYCTYEDGWLHMRGLHCHGLPMLLWDALVQTGYREEVPEYRGRLYMEHSMPRCEVYIDIRSHPVFPDGSLWSMWVIGNDMDDAMEKAAHRHVLTTPVGHRGHAYLTVPDPGPLRSGVDGMHLRGVQRLPGPLPRWLGIHSKICPAHVRVVA